MYINLLAISKVQDYIHKFYTGYCLKWIYLSFSDYICVRSLLIFSFSLKLSLACCLFSSDIRNEMFHAFPIFHMRTARSKITYIFGIVNPLCLLIIICIYFQCENIEYLPLDVIIPKTYGENYNFWHIRINKFFSFYPLFLVLRPTYSRMFLVLRTLSV